MHPLWDGVPCPEALFRRYPGQKVTRWCAATRTRNAKLEKLLS
jgi:hypothetical protein